MASETRPTRNSISSVRALRKVVDGESRRYAGSLALQGGGALMGLVVQTTLARWLGVPGYGLISTVVAVTTVLALVGTMGTNGAALRFVPHFTVMDDAPTAARFVAFSLTTTMVFSCLIGGMFVVVASLSRSKLTLVEAVAAALLIVMTALQLAGTDLGRLADRFTMAYGSVLIVRPVIVAGATGAFLLAGVRGDATVALLALSGAAGAGFLIQLDAVRRGFGLAGIRPRLPARQWLRASPPYLVLSAFQTVLGQIDLLAVSVFLTRTSVGYYAAALKSAAVLSLPYVAVMAVILPRISSFASRRQGEDQALRLLRDATLWTAVITAALALPVLVRPDLVLRLFGASFVTGSFALRMLVLGWVALAAMGPGGMLLVYMDRRRVAIVGVAVCTALSALMCAIGAVTAGIDGAAAASGLSSLLVGVVMYGLSWRYTGVHVSVAEELFPRLRQRAVPALGDPAVMRRPAVDKELAWSERTVAAGNGRRRLGASTGPVTSAPVPGGHGEAWAAEEEEGSSVRCAARLLWRRKVVVCAATIVAVSTTIGYMAMVPKRYQATAELLLTPQIPAALAQATNGGPGAVDVLTAMQIIQSEQVAGLVRKAIGSSPPVSVVEEGLTCVVQVTALSSHRALAQRAADAYVNAYLTDERQQLAQAMASAARIVGAAASSAERGIDAVGKEIAQTGGRQASLARVLSGTQEGLENEATLLQQRLAYYGSLVADQTEESGRLMSPAELPRRPAQPNVRHDLVLGAALGLVLGIGLAFAIEAFRQDKAMSGLTRP